MTEDEYSRIEKGQVAGMAIEFIRAMPRNPDGTVGHVCQKGTWEWDAWMAYFEHTGKHRQAAFMRVSWANGYMVPCPDPGMFDVVFQPEWVKQTKAEKVLSPQQRSELADMITHAFPKAQTKRQVTDNRHQKPQEPEVRPLTEAEIESMKRVAAVKTQKELAA